MRLSPGLSFVGMAAIPLAQALAQPFAQFDKLALSWHALGWQDSNWVDGYPKPDWPIWAVAGNWDNPFNLVGVHQTSVGLCIVLPALTFRTEWEHQQWTSHWTQDAIHADVGMGWKGLKGRGGIGTKRKRLSSFQPGWEWDRPRLELGWGRPWIFLTSRITSADLGDTLALSVGGMGLPGLKSVFRERVPLSGWELPGWHWKSGISLHETRYPQSKWGLGRLFLETEFQWSGGFSLSIDMHSPLGSGQGALAWSTNLVIPWRAWRGSTHATAMGGLGTTFGTGILWSNQAQVARE